jgi:hypothetical protein
MGRLRWSTMWGMQDWGYCWFDGYDVNDGRWVAQLMLAGRDVYTVEEWEATWCHADDSAAYNAVRVSSKGIPF